MAFQVFPYRDEEPRAGRPPVARPTVNLSVSGEHGELMIKALVDTGSPLCIFGRAVADAVGVDMAVNPARTRQMHILGGSHDALMSRVHLSLPPFDGLTWEAECAFLFADLELSFLGILGHEGFLDRWIASFNYYDGYFIIEERDQFLDRLGTDPVQHLSGHFDSEWDRPTRD